MPQEIAKKANAIRVKMRSCIVITDYKLAQPGVHEGRHLFVPITSVGLKALRSNKEILRSSLCLPASAGNRLELHFSEHGSRAGGPHSSACVSDTNRTASLRRSSGARPSRRGLPG